MQTISTAVNNKDLINSLSFVINNEGGFYIVDGQRIPKREFEAAHSIVCTPLYKNKSFRVDGKEHWAD